MRAFLSLLLALLFVDAAGAAVRFQPENPTSASEITLHIDMIWPDSCFPENARVGRLGNTINVLWTLPRAGACLPSGFPWADSVLIGTLPPGLYEVKMRVAAAQREDPLSLTAKLFVRDAAQALTITPSFASTRGGSEVTITNGSFCGAQSPEVIVDGTPVAATIAGCTITATLPARATAGPVDVVVRNGAEVRTVRSAVTYLDPAAAPDEQLFERVLVPLLYIGGGAFGSQWMTQAELFHRGTIPMSWFPDVAKPHCDFNGCEDVVQPNDTIPLTVYGQRSNGLVLFVPRELAKDIHFGAIVRDVSREQTSWGAQLPIVREKDFRSGEIVLPNVVIDPRYRSMLRVYGVDGVGTQVQVQAGNSQPVVVILGGPCTETPCNSNEPAFASLDVASTFPGLAGQATTLVIRPADAERRLWAFASITNNDSQHVTVITPQ